MQNTDKRDIRNIKTDFEKSGFNGHYCVSFKILDNNEKEVSYSEFTKMTLDEIKEKNYSFSPRRFLDKNLLSGDYGILKEKVSSKINFYIIKIHEIKELEFANHAPFLDKEVLQYVEANMKNRKNYKAKYIYFYTDKNYYFDKNKDFGNNITGASIIESINLQLKGQGGTILPLKNPITINQE